MKYQTFIAKNTEKSVEKLVAAFDSIPEDKRTWNPDGHGRTAVNILAECALIMEFAVSFMAGSASSYDWATFPKTLAALTDSDEIRRRIKSASSAFCAAVNDIPDTKLDEVVPSGDGERAIYEWLLFPIEHNQYHIGQLNYIQTLYGDMENH